MRGYDHWKTTEPDDQDGPACEKCGCWLNSSGNAFLYCERCDAPDPDYLYEAWLDREMERDHAPQEPTEPWEPPSDGTPSDEWPF